MPSSLLNEAATLLRIVEIEEIRLHALRHLLEETHCIACSSSKTGEEDGTATNDSDKEEEEDRGNNDLNTTPPTHHNRWTTNQS